IANGQRAFLGSGCSGCRPGLNHAHPGILRTVLAYWLLLASIHSSSQSLRTTFRRPMLRCASFGSPRTLPSSTFSACVFEQRRMLATSLMVRMFDVVSTVPPLRTPSGRVAVTRNDDRFQRETASAHRRCRSAFWGRIHAVHPFFIRDPLLPHYSG